MDPLGLEGTAFKVDSGALRICHFGGLMAGALVELSAGLHTGAGGGGNEVDHHVVRVST